MIYATKNRNIQIILDITTNIIWHFSLPFFKGWLMAVVSVVVIPIVAVWVIWRSYKDPEYEGVSFGRVSKNSNIESYNLVLFRLRSKGQNVM